MKHDVKQNKSGVNRQMLPIFPRTWNLGLNMNVYLYICIGHESERGYKERRRRCKEGNRGERAELTEREEKNSTFK